MTKEEIQREAFEAGRKEIRGGQAWKYDTFEDYLKSKQHRK